MRRAIVALVACLTAAEANSPEPSRETLAFVTGGCTAKGAFGYRFGEHYADKRKLVFPPFEIESVSMDRHDGLYEITAAASFAHAPMSGEDRGALARWVLRQLEAGIAARKPVRRQDRLQGTAFIFSSFVVDLSRDGTTVRVSCTDIARKRHAREEMRLRP